MSFVKNPFANCTAKDPTTCRFHGKKFSNEKFKEFNSFKHMYEILDNVDIPASRTIPYFEPDFNAYYLESNKVSEELDPETRFVLHQYTDELGSREITAYLNNPNIFVKDKPKIEEHIKIIDSFIENHTPKRTPHILYRGVKELGLGLEQVEVGKKISFKAFLSTTSSSNVVQSFTDKNHPVVLEIATSKGVALFDSFMEYEYLLPRNMVFTVDSISENATIEGINDKKLTGVTIIRLLEN